MVISVSIISKGFSVWSQSCILRIWRLPPCCSTNDNWFGLSEIKEAYGTPLYDTEWMILLFGENGFVAESNVKTTFWTSDKTGVNVEEVVSIVALWAAGKFPVANPISVPKGTVPTVNWGPLVTDGKLIAEPFTYPLGNAVGTG